MSRLSRKESEKLQRQLYEGDGTECHYCGIEKKKFTSIWKKKFYGLGNKGQTLERDLEGVHFCHFRDKLVRSSFFFLVLAAMVIPTVTTAMKNTDKND
jgi:hypothetical protein